MDFTFWLGIIIGAVFSFAASVAANVYNNQIADWLASRKLASQSNRYAKAAALHGLVKDLHSGKRDKYIYFIDLASKIVVFSVISVCFMLAALIFTVNGYKETLLFPENRVGVITSLLTGLFLLSGALTIGYSFVDVLIKFGKVSDAIDKFELFDKAFKEKWPNPPNM